MQERSQEGEKRGSITHEQDIICSQTQLDDVHEQIIICRQLFAGHVVGFQPMRRTKNLHRKIMPIMRLYSLMKELVVK